MQNEWIDENNQDRGIVRRQRIYRRLLLSCGIYRENDELNDDFSYIRHYRKRIQNDFNQLFPCDLQVYQSSAYLILDDEVKIGKMFPKNNALDELVVICCSQFRKGIKNNDYKINDQEIYSDDIERILKRIKIVIVYDRLIEIGFAKEEDKKVFIYPVIAKLVGEFDEEVK